MDNYELYHFGIKGMKWGVRRFQNKDGSLTPRGKKRLSKEYKKLAVEAQKELSNKGTDMYVESYNKTADYMNKGGIDKYNRQQQKKYGKNYMDRDNYISDYNDYFGELLTKNLNRSLNEFYKTNKNVEKARALVEKYDMTKWCDLAKENENTIQALRRVVESYEE